MKKNKSSNKTFVVLGAGACVILLIVGAIYLIKSNKAGSDKALSSSPVEQNSSIPKPLLDPEEALPMDQRPIAVMIENHPDSRPQSGLSQADIVYEALAEGGITRQMAIFQTKKADSIGPIRSARPYYIDWAKELSAVYVHVGGSADALGLLRGGVSGVTDLDQYFNGDYFKRITTRQAPHNVYTSTDKLLSAVSDKKIEGKRSYSEFSLKLDSAAVQPDATTIDLEFSLPAFAVRWVYDGSKNSYKRYVAGVEVVDAANKKNVLAKNVVVQRVKVVPIPGDPKLLVNIDTKSGGVADVFMDGTRIKAAWKIVNGRTKYFDLSGKEIAFNAGQTWLEMVPVESAMKVNQ